MKLKIVVFICIFIGIFNLLFLYILHSSSKKSNISNLFKENYESIVEIKSNYLNENTYGTGVIYDSEGLIITNAHVVSKNIDSEVIPFKNIDIRFKEDNDYKRAIIIKIFWDKDLAIIKIEEKGKYKPIKMSTSEIEYGDDVYALGNISNLGIGLSKGIISQPKIKIDSNGINREFIQSNININKGNSGGALVNERFELIGITTLRIKNIIDEIDYGFTYSIPLFEVKKIIQEVK